MALHAEQSNREAFKRLCAAMAGSPKPLGLVGAGTSVRAGYPAWGALLDRMHQVVLEHHDVAPRTQRNLLNQPDLLWRAQEYRQRLGEDEYAAFLRETFRDLPMSKRLDPMLLSLVSLPFNHILTTNYDNVLECAHAQVQHSLPESVEWTQEGKLRDFLLNLSSPERRYVHLHGRASEPRSVVLTDQDYVDRYARSVDAHRKLFAIFATQRLVFVGFSLTDPELAALLREVHVSITAGSARHFALLALKDDEDDTLERRRLKQKYGIDAIFYPFTPSHSQLDRLVEALKRGDGDYGELWDAPMAQAVAMGAGPPPPAASPPPPPRANPFESRKVAANAPPAKASAPGAGRAGPSSQPMSFVESADDVIEPDAALEEERRDYQTGADFLGQDDGGGAAPSLSQPTPKHRADPEDPQRGQWGGRAERNNRRLSAAITALDDGWFKVHIEVRSTDPKRYPLKGLVRFHLHDTFRKPEVDVMPNKGVAVHEVNAFGPFTVGAEVDGGKTQLELDLASIRDAPSAFREF